MNNPKRHHYVPEMITKRFASPDGRLYFCRHKDKALTIGKASPSNLFVEQHLYTTYSDEDEKNYSFEHKLSKFEHQISPIIDKIVACIVDNKLPNVSKEEKILLGIFMYLQWKRVPDLHLHVTTDEQAREMFEQIANDIERQLPEHAPTLNTMKSDDYWKRLLKNTRVAAIGTSPGKVFEIMASRGLAFAKPSKHTKSFAISSHPVVKMGHPSLEHPEGELWVPLSSNVALGIGHIGAKEEFLLLEDAQVRRLNEAITNQSTIVAGSSEKLIRSLAGIR